MKLPAATTLGPVHIAVTDAERALPVWRDLVGLSEIARDAASITLGADGRPLIVLEPGAVRPAVQNTSGLYHVAIHVPTRRELARVTARLIANRYPNSPTDHLVSEAVYLWDLDGNGIEMTLETPSRGVMKSNGDEYYAVTADGRRHSAREAIDVRGLLGELSQTDDLRASLPSGTRVGHIHLHVGDLDKAAAYYGDDGVGFEPLMLNRRFRMGDAGLGYVPHAIAFNTWAGTGAPQAPAGSAGLRWFELAVPTAADLAALRFRLGEVRDIPGGFETTDPAGNRIKARVTI
ncbi:MAG TPA: catechol 1,2-dioxygenase [Bauldia sp.]|nr:catechol 1,2-dioxygenase [Bauldia sp.]